MLPSKPDDFPFRLLLQGITDYAICMLDPQGNITHWNAGAENIKGYRSDEIVGRNFACFYGRGEQDAGLPAANLDLARRTGRFETRDWRYRRDGSRFWANVVIDAIHVDGVLLGFAKITRDCTEQQQQIAALEEMSGNLRLVLSVLPYGACLLDDKMQVVLCNPAFEELFGADGAASAVGTNLFDFVRKRCGASSDRAILDLALFFRQDEQQSSPYEIQIDGVHLSVILRKTKHQGLVATFQDVTERIVQERSILHKARHDALTGLANRDALGEHLDEVLSRTNSNCTVIYFDLNKFKVINDTFGHLSGDVALQEAARRISKALNPGDFICRLGGDEFMAVRAGPLGGKRAQKLGERLCRHISKPYFIDGRQVDLGASIGLASYPDAGTTKNELIGNADIALFKAKRSGGGFCVYDSETGLSVLKRRATELRLRGALAAKEFDLHFQPICGADGADVKGFEALLRWTQASGVSVPPSEFIPLAEELGLMAEIGGWVLDTACLVATSWPPQMTVAVNVSATQLQDEKFPERVKAALTRSGLAACRLEIEITETAMITNIDRTLCILTQLREMGTLIAIDDFGTGYSSLSFLQTLPFTRIKIDRSFVCDIATNGHSMAIVKGVMRISQDLGLSVTAEGVETEQQRLILFEEACHEIQGYLVAKPMARDQLRSFLDKHSKHASETVERAQPSSA